MTKLLEQALAVLRNLPLDEQDDIARVVLMLAKAEAQEPVRLSKEERTAIAASKAAAARGEFASDQDVQAVWNKHGL